MALLDPGAVKAVGIRKAKNAGMCIKLFQVVINNELFHIVVDTFQSTMSYVIRKH